MEFGTRFSRYEKAHVGQYHWSSYWQTWSLILSFEDGWITERAVTPINGCWSTQHMAGHVHSHCTPLAHNDRISRQLPPSVLNALQHFECEWLADIGYDANGNRVSMAEEAEPAPIDGVGLHRELTAEEFGEISNRLMREQDAEDYEAEELAYAEADDVCAAYHRTQNAARLAGYGESTTPLEDRDAQLALLRERNAELLGQVAKLERLVKTQRIVIEAYEERLGYSEA